MKHLHSTAAARGTPLGELSETTGDMQTNHIPGAAHHAPRNAIKANSVCGGIAGFSPD